MTMNRDSGWRKSRMNPGVGAGLLLLLGGLLLLLSGCSTTGDRDAEPGNSPDLANIADAVPKVEPKSKYGNPKSYVVFGKRYYTKASNKGHVERGLASWYGKKFHGRKTSSGERYDMHAMTAAHKTLPLPTYARVTNVKNGRSAVVKINDRGPFHGNRVIDLSYSAARKLGVVAAGTAMVEIRTIDPSRPESNEQDSFLAAGDGASESRTSARKKVVVARKAPAAKKPAPHAKETAIQVAKAEKRNTGSDAARIRLADTTQASAPEPKVATAAIAGKAIGSSMYLQVGAFGSRVNAEQLRRQLVDKIAEQVQVRTIGGKRASWYRVHVGPLDSRKSAKDLSQQLASLGLERSHIVVE